LHADSGEFGRNAALRSSQLGCLDLPFLNVDEYFGGGLAFDRRQEGEEFVEDGAD
jgi:hypothetical protein